MRPMLKVLKYQARDAIRSRWLIAYAIFFALVAEGLLRFSGDATKAQLSLVSIVLFIVPLVTIVFGTVYLYSAREFIELLLAQPLKRRDMFGGLYLGLTLPLALAVVLGVGAPFAVRGLEPGAWASLATLVGLGVVLTFVFAGLATLIAVRCENRMRGLGLAIAVWLLLTVVYDGFVLLVLAVFSDYPLERLTLGMMMANPIDIARIALLLRFDGAALMGYTGAVFLKFFGGAGGVAVAAALTLWVALPIQLGRRVFQQKDF
ncbi:MAG TPA: ABC transporter permease subunit [Gemmatimonadaceae bacterium]|nr:ABC transporter permease subunit [Gemmatimonadaceae bacterium]